MAWSRFRSRVTFHSRPAESGSRRRLTCDELIWHNVGLHSAFHFGEIHAGDVADSQFLIGVEQCLLCLAECGKRLEDGVEFRPGAVLDEERTVAWLARADDFEP